MARWFELLEEIKEDARKWRERQKTAAPLRLHDKAWMREHYGLDDYDIQQDKDDERNGDWTR